MTIKLKELKLEKRFQKKLFKQLEKILNLKSLSQFRANDPDLREMEEVLLEYGTKPRIRWPCRNVGRIMDLKQLIIFGIENSQEPEIKNPILRAALEGPSITAQEPRIGLQGGQLVQNTADGSRPGYGGDEFSLEKKS